MFFPLFLLRAEATSNSGNPKILLIFVQIMLNFNEISPEFRQNFTEFAQKSPHGQHLADSAGPTAHGRPSVAKLAGNFERMPAAALHDCELAPADPDR